MLPTTLQEVSRHTFLINKYDEISLSWHNSILTVRTHKGVSFLHFTYNLKCTDKKLDFSESLVPTTKSSPAAGLFSFIKSPVNNFELSRLMVEPRFWPHNAHIVQEMACVLTCKWSPINLIQNGLSVLAVLNNIGNVDFFESQNRQWVNVLNLSAKVKMQFDVGEPQNMEDLEKAVNTVESCAICWAPKLKDNGSCYFLTAQNNGNILLWLLRRNDGKLNADYQGYIQSDFGEIMTMLWIEKTHNDLLLIVTNTLGQIVALECRINKNIKLIKRCILWSCKDKMLSQHLCYTMRDNKIILFCNKYRHFLALLLDDSCNILSQSIHNINDHRITVITNSSEEYFLGTINCKIYKINFSIINDTLDVKLDLIETKDNMYPNYELHSLQFSENSSLCAVGLVDRKVYVRKGSIKAEVVFFTKNTYEITEMSYLLNNPVKKIIMLWDCIELLRYKIVKLKILPKIDLKQLIEEGKHDIYKLKLYLIIAEIWSTLERNLVVFRGSLPFAIELIQDKIMLFHALSQIKDLCSKYLKDGNLNNFEMETFIGTKKFIEFYSKKYKKNCEDIVSLEVLRMIDANYSYVCQCCDNEIEGFSCKNGHLNMFCSITFTPIESQDYLICTKCQVTARIELYPYMPMCLFCDKYFIKDQY